MNTLNVCRLSCNHINVCLIAAYFVTSSLNYLFSALFFFHRTHCGVTFVDGKSCNRQLSYTIVTVRQYTHTFNVLIYVIWAEFDWDMVHTSSNQFVRELTAKNLCSFCAQRAYVLLWSVDRDAPVIFVSKHPQKITQTRQAVLEIPFLSVFVVFLLFCKNRFFALSKILARHTDRYVQKKWHEIGHFNINNLWSKDQINILNT